MTDFDAFFRGSAGIGAESDADGAPGRRNGWADGDYVPLWDHLTAASDAGEDALRFPVYIEGPYQISELADPEFEPEGTFVLVHAEAGVCGFYMDGQCWVDPEHRGRGLGARLVLAAAEFHGGRPFDAPFGLGFSPAGYAAHVAAHRLAVLEAHESGLPVPGDVLRPVLDATGSGIEVPCKQEACDDDPSP
jgi:GNAT superfamily N-acetyltransferase